MAIVEKKTDQRSITGRRVSNRLFTRLRTDREADGDIWIRRPRLAEPPELYDYVTTPVKPYQQSDREIVLCQETVFDGPDEHIYSDYESVGGPCTSNESVATSTGSGSSRKVATHDEPVDVDTCLLTGEDKPAATDLSNKFETTVYVHESEVPTPLSSGNIGVITKSLCHGSRDLEDIESRVKSDICIACGYKSRNTDNLQYVYTTHRSETKGEEPINTTCILLPYEGQSNENDVPNVDSVSGNEQDITETSSACSVYVEQTECKARTQADFGQIPVVQNYSYTLDHLNKRVSHTNAGRENKHNNNSKGNNDGSNYSQISAANTNCFQKNAEWLSVDRLVNSNLHGIIQMNTHLEERRASLEKETVVLDNIVSTKRKIQQLLIRKHKQVTDLRTLEKSLTALETAIRTGDEISIENDQESIGIYSAKQSASHVLNDAHVEELRNIPEDAFTEGRVEEYTVPSSTEMTTNATIDRTNPADRLKSSIDTQILYKDSAFYTYSA